MALSSLAFALLLAPLLQTEKATVTGVVRLVDGKPAVGVRVAAMAAPQPSTDAVNATALTSLTKTDESGRYRLEGVEPGPYYIVAGRVDAPTYYPGTQNAASATRITVAFGTLLRNLDFIVPDSSAKPAPAMTYFPPPTPMPSVRATGRIVWDRDSIGSKLPETFTLTVRLISPNGTQVSTSRTQVGVDGGFQMFPWTGQSSISVGLPSGYSVKSMTAGSIDLLTRPLDIPTGTTTTPEIVITLAVDSPTTR
jgi:hypothetical protein